MGLVIFPMVKVRRLSLRKLKNRPLHYNRVINPLKKRIEYVREFFSIRRFQYERSCIRSLCGGKFSIFVGLSSRKGSKLGSRPTFFLGKKWRILNQKPFSSCCYVIVGWRAKARSPGKHL
jgi:hypothetical protein